LLIYMDNALQDRVIPIFHYALAPNGVLVLGASETITRHEVLFQPLERSQRIYIRRDGPSDVRGVYKLAGGHGRSGLGSGVKIPSDDPRASWAKAVAFASRRVLERFASPFLVVSASGQIAHFSSHTGRYLEPAAGSPSSNLFDMARRGWALELRAALRRCVDTGRPVEQMCSDVAWDTEKASPVKLIVEPLPDIEVEPLFLIAFVEGDVPRPAGETPETPTVSEGTDATTGHLERENRDLREQLQSIIEEHATVIEELRSSNEELQSVNEELQSTNEELETSREEIQSINEELNTVNGQLSVKVEQLDRSNSDLRNLFDSTQVATVFLDRHLIIRSFTPEIASIYNLIPSDVGRPLTDIVSKLSYGGLRQDMAGVHNGLEPLEKRVEREDGSAHYLMRILPYRKPDSIVDGSLITFVDVTSIVHGEQHQRLLIDELNHRVKNMLTVVISIATNTLRQAVTLDGFKDVFLGRIQALTAAYALLSRDKWLPVAVREVVLEQLHPVIAGESVRVTLAGPTVMAEPRMALSLGLALHELATNAAKHGALSNADGKVDITWVVSESGQLTLQWVERDGPPVTPPVRRGFGLALIERVFAHDVGGESAVDFLPSGVHATLSGPVSGRRVENGPAKAPV
jgi:two-component system CheB/CheR fusion protein